ncbi:MAG: enoyl-CoA hydratase/isomerase family protein [Pusillimonas sp.]
MSDGTIHLSIQDGIASLLIDRPEARNAMTWSMYDALAAACDKLQDDPDVRVATIRGVGGKAFISGTDIEQFRDFSGAEDGVRYESAVEAYVSKLEKLPFPTLAIIDGYAMGGGLALAAACDFRIAAPEAVFGVPIARTLGNCLSANNTARLLASFGPDRVARMLILAESIKAEEAHACGFVHEIVAADQLEARAKVLCERLSGNAPLTMKAAKETMRRIIAGDSSSNEDLIRECYGSRDFRTGMDAFLEKKKPLWIGR